MERIKDIIPQVLTDLSQRKPLRQIQIQKIWQQTLDVKTQKHVAIAGFDNGVLLVLVDSPTRLFQLNLQKKKILENIKHEVPEIESIHLKIGKIK
jgi:hypothetical protein